MPVVTEITVDALGSCKDGRCPGYKQQPAKGIRTTTEFTYFDLGGDIPGVERSTELIRFADIADAQCEFCGEPRLIAEQTRPIYPNVSGVPQDKLLTIGTESERVRDLVLRDAQREAEMLRMQAQIDQLTKARGKASA